MKTKARIALYIEILRRKKKRFFFKREKWDLISSKKNQQARANEKAWLMLEPTMKRSFDTHVEDQVSIFRNKFVPAQNSVP